MELSRNPVLAPVLAVVVASLGFVSSAGAQATPPPISVKQLTPNVYVTQGGAGSNMGIIVGNDGIAVVDAKITVDSAKEGLAEIAKVSPKPITTVLITHSDGDHVNGLAAFPKGIAIIAQENCKKEIEESFSAQRPSPREALPNRTVNMKETTTINGVPFELLHFAPAHTNGDLVIFLPQQRIVFTGDLVNPTQLYTGLHLEKTGSSDGWVTNIKGMLALQADTYVPGHGPVQTRAEVEARLARVIAQRDKIKALVAQGKSLADIKAALGESTPPPAGTIGPGAFTETIYQELTAKK